MNLFQQSGARLQRFHGSPRVTDAATFLIRGVLAYTFIGHGAQKLFGAFGGGGIDGTTQFFASIGIANAHLMATAIGLIEFFGGLCLLIGILTLPAALLLIADMFGAIVTLTGGHGFFVETPNGGWEINFVILGLLGAVALLGAGAWSVDRVLGLVPTSSGVRPDQSIGERVRDAAAARQVG